MRFILLLIIPAFIISSCKKSKTQEEPLNEGLVLQCVQNQPSDSIAIAQKLPGAWKLAHQTCGWAGVTDLNGKTIIITFTNNNTYILTENGSNVSTGSWELSLKPNGWTIELSDFSPYVNGIVYICDQYIYLDANVAADGCATIFKKN